MNATFKMVTPLLCDNKGVTILLVILIAEPLFERGTSIHIK